MKKECRLNVWLMQIRAPFLMLAVVLVMIGVAAADFYAHVEWFRVVLVMTGVILTHMSVNLFNELSDHQTGIDRKTVRTPFSGGSGMMQAGKTSPKTVRIVAYVTLMFSALIGFYFCLKSGWLILAFMIVGAAAIRFYTTHFSHWLIGELISGLTLGSFVVMGTYYALTATLGFEIILLSIPPGILTSLLLLLNEFPDREADKEGGRYHLVVHFGTRISARIYFWSLILLYLIIAGISMIDSIPDSILLALIPFPLAIWAATHIFRFHHDPARLIPAQGMNVAVVILTDLFLAMGYFLA